MDDSVTNLEICMDYNGNNIKYDSNFILQYVCLTNRMSTNHGNEEMVFVVQHGTFEKYLCLTHRGASQTTWNMHVLPGSFRIFIYRK